MASYYNKIKENTDKLMNLIKESFLPHGYGVRAEYVKSTAENPIISPILTVGIYNISQNDSDCALYLGRLTNGTSLYGRTITVTYRITVYCATTFVNSVCCYAATNIAELCNANFNVTRIHSGETTYDSKCRSAVMPIDVTVKCTV